MVRVLAVLAVIVTVATTAAILTSRGASSASGNCSATTSLELVGSQGTPSAGVPVIDLTDSYTTAQASILVLSNPPTASVEVPLNFDKITIQMTGCTIEYDGAAPSVAISGTATDIMPGGDPGETADLLILATWPSGSPVVSFGGHVDGDFDLSRIHSAFQSPQGLTPEFSEVWFTQSNEEQTPPAAYAGVGAFYPSGHVVPVGVAFRAELELAKVIGNRLADHLGYPSGGGRTVAIQGGVPVANGVTIYNDVLSVQNEFTLAGQIDPSGVNGLPPGISFPSAPPWSLTLDLKTTASNAQGSLTTFGIQVGIQGEMVIAAALLDTPDDLRLPMEAKFEYDWASESAVVDLAVTVQGPWSDLFGMNGFSTDSVKVALRASTKPAAQAAKIAVTGTFTANSFTFALTFEVIEKDSQFSAKVIAETFSPITVADLLTAFGQVGPIGQADLGDAQAVLDSISLTGLRAAVKFDTAGPSVFVTADAQVYNLSTSVAFYVGPEKPAESQSKYGFLFGAHVDSVLLVDLIPVLPDSLNVTLPETIFYVSSLKFDADIFGYPDPALFNFFNSIYGTSAAPGEKIIVEAGAGLLTKVQTPPIPTDLQTMLKQTLWMDFNQGMLLVGNVPLFGKTGLSLTLYLPEVVPQESDHAPEWFEGAGLFVQMAVDGPNISFKMQGDLTIRLRKDGASEPVNFSAINPDDYDHLKFSVASDVSIAPPTVDANLTGQLQAQGAWYPYGQQWLTVEQLAIVLNVGTTPDGNAKIGLGLGGAIVLGTGPERLDLEASFLIGVKTLQVFPWVTANIDGLRFQTERGLESTDLITLAEFFGDSLPASLEFPPEVVQAVDNNLPTIAIRDVEISFSKVDNIPLCLVKGFTIQGYLYLNPTSDPPYVQRPPCDSGPPPDCLAAEGCLGGIDIEAVLTAAQPPKIKGKFDLNQFDIGSAIHIGPANIDLEISQAAVHLKLHGQMAIDNVGSGIIDLKFTPNSYELTAEAKLFDAFWAYLDANLVIVPPSFQAHGELKSEFGTQIASALEGETRNLRALLATLDQLYADFQDPTKDLDDLTDSLLNLAPTLRANGADGPLIDLMATFAEEVMKAKAVAEAAGMYPSLDQIVNTILQGATITVTEGVPGSWVDGYCIGYVNRRGTCIGVWVPGHCRLIRAADGSCWLVLPIKFTIPGICPSIVNLPAYGQPCSSQGLKNLAAQAVDGLSVKLLGVSIGPVLHELASGELPALFDLNCAAFDIDLSAQPQGNREVDLFLGITLLGKPIVWQGTWDFDATLTENIGDNRQFLMGFVRNILGGGPPPDPYEQCIHTSAPPPGGGLGTPENLAVTAPTEVSEGVGFTLNGSFTEDGVKPGDTRTYTITWGDGTTTTATLAPGQVSFDVPHTYDDDPLGTNDNRQIAVTVTNSRAGSASKTATIKVNNADPTAGAPQLSATSLDEGQTVTVSGSFSDLGKVGKDTHAVLVTWNDGSQPTAATVNQQLRTYSAQHRYLDDNPTGTAQDAVQISVEISDDDGGKAQTNASLTVKNVPPQVGSLSITPLPALAQVGVAAAVQAPNPEFFEGDQFVVAGILSDPGRLDTHSVKIEWKAQGDWQVYSEIGLEFSQQSFSITLPLPDDDPTGTPEDLVTVKVTVEDDDLGTFSREFPITLKNRDPEDVVVTLDATSINEDDTVGVTVDWADAGIADSHVVVIDWGDGEQTVLDTIEVGERQVWADHRYLDDDPSATASDAYEVRVTVTDDDLGSQTASATLTVNNVDPLVSIESVTDENGAVIGIDVDIAIIATQVTLVGSFTDTGTLDTHTASIDWGDGTVEDLGTVVDSLSVTHVYWAPCHCTITLTVTDDDTGAGSATRAIEAVDASGASANVIDDLLPRAGDPNVAAAISKLWGNNGGLDANGALDMLEKGNLGAALGEIRQALQYLEAAEAVNPALDLTQEKGLLALAAKSVAVIGVREATAAASRPKDVLKAQTATDLIAQGDGLRLATDFVGAVGEYLDAVRQVQGIR